MSNTAESLRRKIESAADLQSVVRTMKALAASSIGQYENSVRSGATYEPVTRRLLPLDETWRRQLAELPWPTKNLPEIFGPGTETLLALIREYLFVSIFRASAESLASENSERLAAMQRADKNIADLLVTLHGTFHRLRQSSIDEELFDVISASTRWCSRTNPRRSNIQPVFRKRG